jgi:hypothetical protein
MGNSSSIVDVAVELIAPRRRTRSEEFENLLKPQKLLRTGSVTRSIQRHLGQAKVPRHEVPIRQSKSLDHLWEPHPEHWKSLNGGLGDDDSDTDSVRPRVPNPSMPPEEEEPVTATPRGLCDTCLEISIDTASVDGGHPHLLVSEVYESECMLCSRISFDLGLNSNKRYTGDRYQVFVSLERQSESTDVVQHPW